LYHAESMFGHKIEQLCVPLPRRMFTLKTAHEMLGGHMAERKTKQRIKLSGLFWPNIKVDTKQFCSNCYSCQTRALVTCYDRVPIKAVPRADETFSH
jgi:Integrase zinc binding domain